MKPTNILALPMLIGVRAWRAVGLFVQIFAVVGVLVSGRAWADDDAKADKSPDADRTKLIVNYAMATAMGWKNSSDPERAGLYTEMEGLVNALEENTEELRKNYEDVKANEQSAKNRMIGAAGIGGVGIGGMQLAQGMAEKKADESAEQDMKAYLATFTCRYGEGKSVRGGTVGVELPGGNDLIDLVTQYKELAADLKMRKEALDMMPGIESEVILDKATAGLYDDVSLGKNDGAYTSVANALLDENSEDAAEWAAQKADAQKRIKTGATVAAVAAVGSLAANLIANKNSPKERSAEILSKRYEIQQGIDSLIQSQIDKCNEQIRTAKSDVAKLKSESGTMSQFTTNYVNTIESLQELPTGSNLIELADHPVCK